MAESLTKIFLLIKQNPLFLTINATCLGLKTYHRPTPIKMKTEKHALI
jgi:hypothetical protein